jgi:hypothetical protein
MKKVSKASFICAIILIVCAIVLNVIGFSYLNGVRVYRHVGYGFMQMTYSASSSMTNTCFAMIMAGGFLFIGGILLLMLSAMTRCPGKKCCHEHKVEQPAEEVKAEEPKAIEDCTCKEQAPSEEKTE